MVRKEKCETRTESGRTEEDITRLRESSPGVLEYWSTVPDRSEELADSELAPSLLVVERVGYNLNMINEAYRSKS